LICKKDNQKIRITILQKADKRSLPGIPHPLFFPEKGSRRGHYPEEEDDVTFPLYGWRERTRSDNGFNYVVAFNLI